MEEKMSNILALMLNQIFQVGMSTANAISRIGFYEPDEDAALMEMLNKQQITSQNE